MSEDVDDPIDALSYMVDDFASYVSGSEKEHRESVRYRLNLLWVHAFAACLIAPAFAMSTLAGGSFRIINLVPYAPYWMGAIIGTGGVLLGIGCIMHRPRAEIAGLCVLAFWYALISITFTGSVILYLMSDPRPVAAPTYYAPFLYLHLTIIMLVHVGTLIRRSRADREHPWTSRSTDS